MIKIGFIGAYDKTDLIIYVAKILTMLGKKVLVVDATITQKAKYIVPNINPSTTYVTEYEEIDVAVGFPSMEYIQQYLGYRQNDEMDYDFALVDVDNRQTFHNFRLEESKKNYFVTSFDVYSLRRGLEILAGQSNVINLTKILFARDIFKEDDDYLNFLAMDHKIIWNEYRIYFPIENGDLTAIYENQRVAKIKLKKLSVQYKDSLSYIVEDILGNASSSSIRQAIKTIEKGA